MAKNFAKTGVIIRENTAEAIGTLANQNVKRNTDLVLEEDFRMLKTEVQAIITGATTGQSTGLLFGIADGELTDTEVEEVLVLDGPVDRNDNLAQERAGRFVKTLGMFVRGATTETLHAVGIEGGPMIISKPRWTFSNPEGWVWFVFNNSQGSFTTGATLAVTATSYGVWVT